MTRLQAAALRVERRPEGVAVGLVLVGGLATVEGVERVG